jgi:hypothetical protein
LTSVPAYLLVFFPVLPSELFDNFCIDSHITTSAAFQYMLRLINESFPNFECGVCVEIGI